jgi:sialate O-acetylesterase
VQNNKKMKRILSIILCAFVAPLTIWAEVKLPAIFSDNMVMQRDQEVVIWGWADKNEKVDVTFNGRKLTTKADQTGNWKVTLRPAPYGGPYTLTVNGKNSSLTLKNILVGDVWLCSGQSNMEWTVANSMNADQEIKTADYPQIRSFNVKHEMAAVPKNDFSGKWEVCSPDNAGSFSAVAYYFARTLYQKTGIPIGIINSSWGGTDIETWISPDVFNSLNDSFKTKYKIDGKLEDFFALNEKSRPAYEASLENDLGLKETWQNPLTDISAWGDLPVPQIWNLPDLSGIDGVVWIQYDIVLPESVDGKPAVMRLGKIDDDDNTWINGIKVGATVGYDIPRVYNIPSNVLKPGINRISIRIVDTASGGGVYGEQEDVFLAVGSDKYSLSGTWKYKLAESNKKYNYLKIDPNIHPSLLYNAMIHPIIRFALKGVIWYQGENNANDAYAYQTLFPTLITDWRSKWGQEFPFYWVQLANYMRADNEPEESEWAELREAQTMTLSLPRTGQAVIIDIGETLDIHPRNKQDVGLRLALNALNKDYGQKEIVYSGPMYKSMEIAGNKIILTFDYATSGFKVSDKYAYIRGFAIAGADKKFVWAKAYIDGDKIIVYSDQIQQPVAVRYNWGNNPDGNLYNKEGLPACPFRTDKPTASNVL